MFIPRSGMRYDQIGARGGANTTANELGGIREKGVNTAV